MSGVLLIPRSYDKESVQSELPVSFNHPRACHQHLVDLHRDAHLCLLALATAFSSVRVKS